MNEEKKIVLLDVNDILPNRFQPRIKFNEDSINELSESIKKYGVIEPIVVRSIGDKYEIIAGERRYKASLLAGKEKVPAIVTTLDDKDSAEVALIENVQREDLTPIEEAISYKKILDMGYLTQEELASKLGKNQGTVANKLRLLNLTDEVQEALLEEKISERHARSLLKLKNENDQIEMLNNIINNRLTVRKTDEEITKMLSSKNQSIVDRKEEVVLIEERKEDKNMNEFNPFENNDNLLTNEIPEFNVFEKTVDNNENINPGFMDVSKIEETAQDINNIKPQANLNNLLTPTVFEENEEPVVVEEQPILVEEQQNTIQNDSPTRFFNVPYESTDSIFNPFSTKEKTEEAEFVSNLEAVNNNNKDNNINQAFNFNFTPLTNDNSINKEPVVIDEPKENIVEPLTTVLPLENELEPEQIKEESVIVEEPKENIVEPTFNYDELLSSLPDISSNNIPSVNNEEVLEIKEDKNLMEALNIIRECSKKVEQLGYNIDTEEIDFDNLYQIVFKIKK